MLIDSVKFNKGDRPIKSVGAETMRMLPFDWLIVGDNFVFKKFHGSKLFCYSGIVCFSYLRFGYKGIIDNALRALLVIPAVYNN